MSFAGRFCTHVDIREDESKVTEAKRYEIFYVNKLLTCEK